MTVNSKLYSLFSQVMRYRGQRKSGEEEGPKIFGGTVHFLEIPT